MRYNILCEKCEPIHFDVQSRKVEFYLNGEELDGIGVQMILGVLQSVTERRCAVIANS